ncbi:hypothetical protein [Nocardioides sp. W7]|uniref:hypothetical protein n=1 Tax=Nocardioides sp. W7 TaxID=2931390 RepID=UPI001FD432A8|nr:hypothetical protein [Nocardioides sp. W7]
MRVRRLLAALVTTGLIAPTAVIVGSSTAPASAVTATSIVPSAGRTLISAYSAPIAFGDTLSTSVNVLGADGEDVYVGSITVDRQIAGRSTWTRVASNPSAYLYTSLKAAGNATYRISYSGGTTSRGVQYAPTSTDVTVKVQRDMVVQGMSGRQAGFKGKLKPKGKVKIIVQKKVGKKFKTYKKLRTNRKGRFTIVLPAPKHGKFTWKITFAGSKSFTKSAFKGTTFKR